MALLGVSKRVAYRVGSIGAEREFSGAWDSDVALVSTVPHVRLPFHLTSRLFKSSFEVSR